MSLGNVLIRPQILNRRAINDEAQLVDLLTGLAARVLEDLLRGGAARPKIEAAMKACEATFVAALPQLQPAQTKLLALLKPYLDKIEAVKNPSSDLAGLQMIVDATFDLAYQILDDLKAERIAVHLNALLDIVETDLGLSRARFENFFLDCISQIETHLAADFLSGTRNNNSINNFLLSVQIKSIRRQVGDLLVELPLPELNIREGIRELTLALTDTGWNESLGKLRQQLDDLKKSIPDLLKGLSDVLRLQTPSSVASRDFSDGASEYAWYISWLLGKPTDLDDRFTVASGIVDKVRFKRVSLGFLEHWMLIGRILIDATGAIGNITLKDKGNQISPIINFIEQGSRSILDFISIFMDSSTWFDFMKVKENGAFKFATTELIAFFGSLEQIDDFWKLWLYNRSSAQKSKEYSLFFEKLVGEHSWLLAFVQPAFLHNLSLDVLTLLNHESGQNVKNLDKTTYIRQACVRILTEFGVKKAISGRLYFDFTDHWGWSILLYLGGGASLFAANITGWVVAGLLSGERSSRFWEFNVGGLFSNENVYGAILFSIIDFHTAYDLEGDTEGGRYGLKRIKNNTDFEKTRFRGYPNRNTSPYILPFDGSKLVFCSQTHRGRSSHNYTTGLIYAVDFRVKKSASILAMRGGVVTDYSDDREQTFLTIKHDDVKADHDQNDAGSFGVTYGHYKNGAHLGIRRAFAVMGIPASKIIGSRVLQGMPIMIMGSSPRYLQVHVSMGLLGDDNNYTLPTIPFVFKDLPKDGVPRMGKYYSSTNINPMHPLSMSRYQPDNCAGTVRGSGSDFIILQETANDNDDFYNGAHLFVSYPLPNQRMAYEYQTIKAYNGGDRKVTIDGVWNRGVPPQTDVMYRIGANHYAESSDFDKQFAYFAKIGDTVMADGQPVDTWFNAARYHAPILSGSITGGGTKGSNQVHLDAAAAVATADLHQRHLIVFRKKQMFDYRLIQGFKLDAGTPKVTIEGTWDIDLSPITDTYSIGATRYGQPEADAKKAFFAPDNPLETPTPVAFADGKPPYPYGTYPEFDIKLI